MHGEYEQYQHKISQARDAFTEVYSVVKARVEKEMS